MSTPSDELPEITVTASPPDDDLDEIETNGTKLPTPTLQYLRKFSLIIAGESGQNGLDFKDFKVTFEIRRGDMETPNTLDVRIYNVSTKTALRIGTEEFTQVTLQAGYEGSYGLLFRGNIKQVRIGKLNGKDSYIDITAADGDEFYNFSAVSLTYAAGPNSAPNDLAVLLGNIAEAGLQRGYVPTLSANGRLRGRVYYGMTRDKLREFAANIGCVWSIQDGAFTLIPTNGYIPGDPIVISSSTGMIGVPERTQNGIMVRILINPAIRIGQLIKIEGTINQFRNSLTFSQLPLQYKATLFNKLNANGLYYVMAADHVGDTRGNDWYTDLTCLTLTAQPNTNVTKATVLPDSWVPRT